MHCTAHGPIADRRALVRLDNSGGQLIAQNICHFAHACHLLIGTHCDFFDKIGLFIHIALHRIQPLGLDLAAIGHLLDGAGNLMGGGLGLFADSQQTVARLFYIPGIALDIANQRAQVVDHCTETVAQAVVGRFWHNLNRQVAVGNLVRGVYHLPLIVGHLAKGIGQLTYLIPILIGDCQVAVAHGQRVGP